MCVIEFRHRESNLILRRGLSAAFAWRRSRVTSACMLAGLRILTNQATSLCTGREYSNTSAKGHLLPQEIVRYATSHLCDGLSQAHELGLIHRHLMPANVGKQNARLTTIR